MPFFYYYDPTYILLIPALILSIFAQIKVKSSFSKYSQMRNSRGITGADAARRVLSAYGVMNVNIERVSGNLTDHYDPKTNVIRLSDQVYSSDSVAAVGVACHEAGHAVQYAQGYFPIKLRSVLVPITNIGSTLAMPLLLIGLFINSNLSPLIINLALILYSLSVIFTVITLPVEFNASRRALKTIKETNMLYDDREYNGAKSVLTAAAMTYVAATLSALLNFLRIIIISNNRRR